MRATSYPHMHAAVASVSPENAPLVTIPASACVTLAMTFEAAACNRSSMASVPSERRYLTVRLCQAEDQVQVYVVDRGPGISKDVMDKLFTPFFSTKADGMGMGLNICRSIIEFHRGRLWVEENPEGGTVLVISLPVIQS